jgi:hypothetical protein
MNMLPHAFKQHLLAHQVVLPVIEHPVTHLIVPHQGMPAQPDTVLPAESRYAVGSIPGPHTVPGMNGNGLHVVFGSHAAELPLYQVALERVRDIALINRDTYKKVFSVCVFQSLPFLGHRADENG